MAEPETLAAAARVSAYNFLDIAGLVVMSLFAVRGIFRGLSGELARLISAAAAFVLGLWACAPASAWMTGHTRLSESVARATAFVATVIAVMAVMIVARLILKRLMKVAFEPSLDRIGGLVAGFLRGTVFVVIVFFLVGMIPHEYLNRLFGEESAIGRTITVFTPSLREKAEEIHLLPGNKSADDSTESKPEPEAGDRASE